MLTARVTGVAYRTSSRRFAWGELLRRVFAIDALACPARGGRMEMTGVVQEPGRDRRLVDGGARGHTGWS